MAITNAAQNVVAVSNELENVAGAMVWWELAGQTELAALRAAFVELQLDAKMLPRAPTPEAALRRTMRALAGKRRLVRPTEDGWAVVNEEVVPDTTVGSSVPLEYQVELEAWLDEGGTPAFKPAPPPAALFQLQQAYQHHLSFLASEDASAWLVGVAEAVQAVPLRDRGGFYFVPRFSLDAWRKYVAALGAAADHRVYSVPALSSREAVSAVVAAVSREAQEEIAAVETELQAGGLGARALRHRVGLTEAVEGKVSAYAELLGESLDLLTARLRDLRGTLSAALLAREAEDDQETIL